MIANRLLGERRLEGMMRRLFACMGLMMLASCASFTPSYSIQGYEVSQENLEALKKYGPRKINVGTFANFVDFDNSCRVTAGTIVEPAGGFEGYIQRAFVKELQHADMYDDSSPVTLTATIDRLELYTRTYQYMNDWFIGVRLDSSNGQSEYITQRYEFGTGVGRLTDCQRLADQYMSAVQMTLNKLIKAPEFEYLVTP